MTIKYVPVVLSGLFVPAPDTLLDAGKHRGIVVVRRPIGPQVVRPPGRMRVLPGRLKPRMLRRGVLNDQLDDDPQPQLAGAGNQLNHIGDGAESRIRLQMIADVIAIILQRGKIKRGQPENRRPEATNVV